MVKAQIIDFNEADGYAVTDADLVVNKLKIDGQYSSNLFFRGLSGERLNVILEHGTDRPDSDIIFCGNEEELRESGTMNALEYAFEYSNPALAVYDGSKLTPGDSYQSRRFIEPEKKIEALVAVYLLRG